MAAAASADNSGRIDAGGAAAPLFPRLLASSWVASVVTHVLLLFVLATTLRSCGPAGH